MAPDDLIARADEYLDSLPEGLRAALRTDAQPPDPDYTTDTAHHPFEGIGTFCERKGCGEACDWHPKGTDAQEEPQ